MHNKQLTAPRSTESKQAMFSMRYTSPKATKKGDSPGSEPALGPTSLSSIDVSAIHDDFRNSTTTNRVAGTCNGNDETPNSQHSEHDGELADSVSTNRRSTLTDDVSLNISRNIDFSDHSLSEANSAAATVSENIDPRPINLIALADRENAYYVNNCGEESNSAKDVDVGDYIDSGMDTAANGIRNMHSIEASSTNSEGHTSNEARKAYFQYQRSTSMEPMVGVLPVQSQPITNSSPAGRKSHPRPINLPALLGRGHEYHGSDCGEGPDKDTLQRGAAKEVDGRDYIDSGMDTAANGIRDMHSIEASSTNSEGLTSNEARKAYLQYQRSTSMEPMVGVLPVQSQPIAHAISAGRKAPVVGRASFPLRSSRDMTNDTQITSPSTSKRPCSPIAYDMMAPVDSPFSGVTDSEIGSDRYFDLPHPHDEEKKLRTDSISDELVHVTLPPRVNRTTLPKFPCNPARAVSAPPILSPRPTFTHSLLDDCSDEEDETTTFTIVDCPTHIPVYSCLAPPVASSKGSSTFASYFEDQNRNRQSAGTANQKASKNIQQALLQTRHRRWDCQSVFAGSHAQSKEVMDISNRFFCMSRCPPGTGHGEFANRLSVSVEAVRVAALASGLWRTVKRVRLPRGLFVDRSVADNEIPTLLRCLGSTFPMLNSVDFCGDISRVSNTSDKFADSDWRDEIVSCIMECLPNIVAIDGFVVEERAFTTAGHTDDDSISGLRGSTNLNADSSTHAWQQVSHGILAPSKVYESVAMIRLDSEAQNGLMITSAESMGSEDQIDITSNSRFAKPNREETSTVPGTEQIDVADDFESHGSQDKALPADIRTSTHLLQNSQQTKIVSPLLEPFEEELKKTSSVSPTSSMLSSSLSWGSNASKSCPPIGGTRPPACPTSASRPRSQLPAKPLRKKKTYGSIMKTGIGLKRRVLGLIPTVSMMDADVDEDSDDSVHAVDSDCPTDLL